MEDCKYVKCNFMGTQIDYGNTGDNYGDEKHYCWSHKKIVIKKYKNEKLNKIKEEKKQIKLKEKEDLKKAKDEAKQKAKDEKQKAKDELKQLSKINKKETVSQDNTIVIDLTNENVVIGVLSVPTESVEPILLCQEILKTGNNKGSQCGNKIFENNLCKRHMKKQINNLV